MPPKIIAIVAMDNARVIGFNNQLPWKIPEDMKRFSQLTTGHTVLMGRKTYQSLPKKFRPLPNRRNVVVSRDPQSLKNEEGIEVRSDVEQFMADVKSGKEQIAGEILWVIGGAEIYVATKPFWDAVRVTLVDGAHQGDAFFPKFEGGFIKTESEAGSGFEFLTYSKK